MNTFTSFQDLDIPISIKQALQDMNFQRPTPIQAQAIPAGLAGRDVVGTAQTGTGKTAAFGVPLLSSLYSQPGKQALILAPTRELAAQIHKVLRQVSKGSSIQGSLIVGGESFNRQANEMANGADYLVATPGRLNDHLDENTANLSNVGILVLDEVDRMLDMGFLPQLRSILRKVPKSRQTLLFSATLPPEVSSLVAALVSKPIRVAVGDLAKPVSTVKEEIRRIRADEKNELLLTELRSREGRVLIFVRTKSRTHRVLRLLDREGFSVVVMHGGRSQAQRKQALERFRAGTHGVMVATDLAGRGLDIANIDHVINYDVPATRDDYIHRIGRTGRAGGSGTAISFVVEGDSDQEFVVTGQRPRPAVSPAHERHNPRAHGRQAKPRHSSRPVRSVSSLDSRQGGAAPKRVDRKPDSPSRGRSFGPRSRSSRAKGRPIGSGRWEKRDSAFEPRYLGR